MQGHHSPENCDARRPVAYDRRHFATARPRPVELAAIVLLVSGLLLGGFAWGSGRVHLGVPASPQNYLSSNSPVPGGRGSSDLTPAFSPNAAGPAGQSPAAGFSLSMTGASPSAISLQWTPSTVLLFSSYTVAVSASGSSGPWTNVAVNSNQTQTDFGMAGLEPGATYWWQVTAAGLSSQTTNVLAVKQPTLAYLSYTLVTATVANFTWTNNASYGGLLTFASYNLLESANGGSPSIVATSINATRTWAVVSGLLSGTSYSFYLNTTDCVSACATTPPSVTGSNSVTLGSPVSLVASLTAFRGVVDIGQPDYFTCTPSGGRSPYSFSWNYGNGTFAAGGSGVSRSFTIPGPATIVCKVVDALASVSTASVSVNVEANLVLSASANRTAADAQQVISFRCSVTFGLPPYSVTWSLGDGNESSGTTTTHFYSRASLYQAICSVTDQTGSGALSIVNVTVSPRPVVSINLNSRSAAPGTLLTFGGSPSNGSGGYSSFGWSFGDGSSVGVRNASHAFLRAGNFTVLLQMSDSNGALAQATAAVVISVVAVSFASLPSSATAGNSVMYSASASGGAGGPYNFSWSFGDGGTAYGATVHHVFASEGSFHSSLRVTDRLGATQTVPLPSLTSSAHGFYFSWLSAPLVLLAGAAVGAIFGLGEYRRSRKDLARHAPSLSGWVPGQGTAGIVRGLKVCPQCGASNVPMRIACESCGATLPRRPELR